MKNFAVVTNFKAAICFFLASRLIVLIRYLVFYERYLFINFVSPSLREANCFSIVVYLFVCLCQTVYNYVSLHLPVCPSKTISTQWLWICLRYIYQTWYKCKSYQTMCREQQLNSTYIFKELCHFVFISIEIAFALWL